jgi:hypothetical protein
MRIAFLLLTCLCLATARADEVLDKLIADLDRIRSVSCEVERVTASEDGQLRLLIRVFYQHGGRLHVENVKPARRRIITDGTTLYFKAEGFEQGFSAPLADLEKQDFWRDQIRRIPGTASDHLWRIASAKVPGENLDPEPGLPVRRGYATARLYAVLALDDQGRLARVEYFRDATRKERTAVIDYSEWKDGGDGIWVAQVHKALLKAGAGEVTENTRVLNLKLNQPVADSLFDPKLYFQGVKFVADYAEMK